MINIKSNLDFLERLAADFHSNGHAQTAIEGQRVNPQLLGRVMAGDLRRAVKDIQNLRDYASRLERSIHEMSATIVSATEPEALGQSLFGFTEAVQKMFARYGFTECPLHETVIAQMYAYNVPSDTIYSVGCDVAAGLNLNDVLQEHVYPFH